MAATASDLRGNVKGLPGDSPLTMSVDVIMPDGDAVILPFGTDAAVGDAAILSSTAAARCVLIPILHRADRPTLATKIR